MPGSSYAPVRRCTGWNTKREGLQRWLCQADGSREDERHGPYDIAQQHESNLPVCSDRIAKSAPADELRSAFGLEPQLAVESASRIGQSTHWLGSIAAVRHWDASFEGLKREPCRSQPIIRRREPADPNAIGTTDTARLRCEAIQTRFQATTA